MSTSAFAQVGGAAVVFLQIEPDGRSAAMGNAGVAVADNANAQYWNPAGLAFQRGMQLSITHSPWLPEFQADLFFDYLAATYHVDGWGTFGAHVTYFNLGRHEARDASNQFLGEFRSYEMAVGGSYGVQIGENLGLGTGVRLIYSNLAPAQIVGAQETKAGVSVGFDAAALYRKPMELGNIGSELSLGINLANMGPAIQYSDGPQSDPIPMNLRFGWGFKMDFDEYNSLRLVNDFNKLLISKDAEGNVDPFYQAIFTGWSGFEVNTGTQFEPEWETLSAADQLTIGLGLEYWYNQLFSFRSGYFYENPNNGDRQFVTFGAGLRYQLFGVDFSYIYPLKENSPLARTIRFSVLVGK